MKESIFTTELKKSFQSYSCFAHKISDMPHFAGKKTRFDKPKPFDLFVGFKGYFIPIECKQMRKPGSFGLKDMRPAQIEGLDKCIETGNDAWVMLNLRMPAGIYNKKIKFNNLDRLLIFPWGEVKEEESFNFEKLLKRRFYKKFTTNGVRVYSLTEFLEAYGYYHLGGLPQVKPMPISQDQLKLWTTIEK